MNLKTDPKRTGEPTGIYVRAQRPDGSWDSVDIYELDKESLLTWLEKTGWGNSVVLILLGHRRTAPSLEELITEAINSCESRSLDDEEDRKAVIAKVLECLT